MYVQNGMAEHPHYNFDMGVSSGMASDPDLQPLLLRWKQEGAPWQVTAIGRQEVWALHQRAANLGGALRTGLEDTFYLPDGTRASSNGPLIEALADCARRAGREIASPQEARAMLTVRDQLRPDHAPRSDVWLGPSLAGCSPEEGI